MNQCPSRGQTQHLDAIRSSTPLNQHRSGSLKEAVVVYFFLIFQLLFSKRLIPAANISKPGIKFRSVCPNNSSLRLCCVPQRSGVRGCNYSLSPRRVDWLELPCSHIRENKKSEVSGSERQRERERK